LRRVPGWAAGVVVAWAAGGVFAQAPARPHAAEILLALKRLRVLASVLYVGAHPDDENTSLIAVLAKGRLADVAYLSMTRGDGGQNLIGPEIGAALGIIRSQELLAARRIDGGRQYFTRAIDFGFSKSAEETLRFWDREQVLADTVRVYREFQPDVVITRFPVAVRPTHGHHTASAILAREAFDAAADPARFPGSPGGAASWRPRRLLWNTSPWFYGRLEEFKADALLRLDSGVFSPLLGESFAELAARGGSMHRSQGFGEGGTRGEVLEYLEHVAGDPAREDLFEGIDTTWGRIPGGPAVGRLLDRAYREFSPENPSAVVPALLEARGRLQALPHGRWRTVKLADLEETIAACLGLYLEAAASAPAAARGDRVQIHLEAANRSPVPVTLERVTLPAAASGGQGTGSAAAGNAGVGGAAVAAGHDLNGGGRFAATLDVALPPDLPDSQPYWLRRRGTAGMFRVDDPALVGLPENPPVLAAVFALEVDGVPFSVERPVVYKWTDPASGERYRPFEVIPAVAVDLSEDVFVFPDTRPREAVVRVRAGRAGIGGTVRLEAPPGWRVAPASREFRLERRDESATARFEVRPPDTPSAGVLKAVAEVGGERFDRGLVRLEYPHIPSQVYLPEAEARAVRLDLKRRGRTIGYLQGAGDRIPAGLRQVGYTVVDLAEDDLHRERLRRFDAVILGVRAYNTLEWIGGRQQALFDYAKSGGTLIVQYNTNRDLHADRVAPYPLAISRARVAEEDAEVRPLLPDHPVLRAPNRITPADFDGWVQERGLYFAGEWDGAFQAILSSNDRGEPPRDGGLLIARHGAGHVVYTGYSFFRQIPAGVPGAYRLFVNLISLGRQEGPALTPTRAPAARPRPDAGRGR
jgi:LmbE family N-acetylglucosaminyl deacetylase